MVTKSAKDYLEALAEALEISATRYDQAHERYHSLGKWLNRDASSIKQFDPTMYSQGSFAFGTVIMPYTDSEEYKNLRPFSHRHGDENADKFLVNGADAV